MAKASFPSDHVVKFVTAARAKLSQHHLRNMGAEAQMAVAMGVLKDMNDVQHMSSDVAQAARDLVMTLNKKAASKTKRDHTRHRKRLRKHANRSDSSSSMSSYTTSDTKRKRARTARQGDGASGSGSAPTSSTQRAS